MKNQWPPLSRDNMSSTPHKERISLNSVLNVVASIFTLVAAFIAIYGGVTLWVSVLLSLFIVLVMGALAWRPALTAIQSTRKKREEARIGHHLLSDAIDIAYQLQEQMEFRTDSLCANLFGLNQSGIFGDQSAPHPARIQIALNHLIRLMEKAPQDRQSVVDLLSLFDMLFAVFHEHHLKIPADRALKHKPEIQQTTLDQIRKSWPRYEALLEGHRRFCAKANKAFDLHLGNWCHEVPTPL